MHSRVGIIGGGVAGLSLAALLGREMDVKLFEEHGVVGYPKHCTGVISSETLKLFKNMLFEPPTLANSKEVEIHASSRSLLIDLSKNPIYIVDRQLFEEKLLDNALNAGVEVELGARVRSFKASSNGVTLIAGGKEESFNSIAIAEGAARCLSRKLKCPEGEVIYGINYLVKISECIESKVHVFFTKSTPGLFAWFIPTGGEAIVGYGGGLIHRDKLLNYIAKRTGIELRGVVESYGGLINIAKPCNLVHYGGRIYLTGDSAALNKPLTGGGLYAIARLTPMLANAIKSSESNSLINAFRAFEKRHRVQLNARRAIMALGGLHIGAEALARSLEAGGLIEAWDFDHHEEAILRSIKHPVKTLSILQQLLSIMLRAGL
ncbi:MAG: NAD(P)/FAD-dependent oxidoreductase [Sulfolobales archaeon]|nr:NAD(P)/FAD-dependent oxidoreductase [Sulfolobales archaeon]